MVAHMPLPKKDISNSQDSTASLVVVALERNLDAFSLD
jgi:hypothetical protein